MNNMNTKSEVTESVVTDPDMSLIDAIYGRRSVRGFLDKEIPNLGGTLLNIYAYTKIL